MVMVENAIRSTKSLCGLTYDGSLRKTVKPLPRIIYRLNKLRWRLTNPITVGVRLILNNNQQILLVKHTYQQHWYLPGGGVRKGETIEQATRREAAEELGAELMHLRLFGVYTNFYDHKNDHVIVFACDDFTFTGETDDEIERFSFFGFNDLPKRISPGSLRRLKEYVTRDGGPTVDVW